MIEQKKVSWFSAGVSSAVATKLALDAEMCDEIIYCHIDDQHEDTMRFVRECEAWFNRPITILQSNLKSVENACLSAAYLNGVRGASCTRLLKRRVRQEWEAEHRFFNTFLYVWGFDKGETDRANRLRDNMPEDEHYFPLIEKGLTKQYAHALIESAGIKRPAMYDLGYPNNNCIGCIKGGKGYWNQIRVDFPEVFAARAALERRVGGSCINGVYLDELPPDAGRDQKMIVPECGAMCEAELGSFANN